MFEHQNVGHDPSPVCKHHQRGYCRNGSQCHQVHNSNICRERVCRNPMCRERHPKTCKFYLRVGGCKWKEDCAYMHKKMDSNIKIDILESKVKKLKDDIKQLTTNMSELIIKLITLEERDKHGHSMLQPGGTKEGLLHNGLSSKGAFNCDQCSHISDTNSELTKHVEIEHEVPEFFQCNICKSCFDTKVQLKKHTNTKHSSADTDDYNFKCKVCNKLFWNSLDLISHLNDHVVKENVKYTECHDEPFRCKICGIFTSINDNDIRTHVINHVEDTLKPRKDTAKDVTEILSTIEEEQEDSETERDESEEEETTFNDSYLYAGFDEDGNRITDEN